MNIIFFVTALLKYQITHHSHEKNVEFLVFHTHNSTMKYKNAVNKTKLYEKYDPILSTPMH